MDVGCCVFSFLFFRFDLEKRCLSTVKRHGVAGNLLVLGSPKHTIALHENGLTFGDGHLEILIFALEPNMSTAKEHGAVKLESVWNSVSFPQQSTHEKHPVSDIRVMALWPVTWHIGQMAHTIALGDGRLRCSTFSESEASTFSTSKSSKSGSFSSSPGWEISRYGAEDVFS